MRRIFWLQAGAYLCIAISAALIAHVLVELWKAAQS
jgi:hypothetical protein